MTVSVTPDGVIGPGLVTSTPTLPAGHSAAFAAPVPKMVTAANKAAADTRAKSRLAGLV